MSVFHHIGSPIPIITNQGYSGTTNNYKDYPTGFSSYNFNKPMSILPTESEWREIERSTREKYMLDKSTKWENDFAFKNTKGWKSLETPRDQKINGEKCFIHLLTDQMIFAETKGNSIIGLEFEEFDGIMPEDATVMKSSHIFEIEANGLHIHIPNRISRFIGTDEYQEMKLESILCLDGNMAHKYPEYLWVKIYYSAESELRLAGYVEHMSFWTLIPNHQNIIESIQNRDGLYFLNNFEEQSI